MKDLSKFALEHKKVLDLYVKLAETKPDIAMSNAYHFIKQVCGIYYRNNSMDKNYSALISPLTYLEATCLGSKNMIKFSKKFCAFEHPTPSKNDMLNYLIWNGRKYIMGHGIDDDDIVDLYDWHFQYQCVKASDYIYELCNDHNIKCKKVIIYPGYDSSVWVDSHLSKHCFNIIEYNDKNYLVDITYAQFFKKCDNALDRLGVVGLEGPSVGCYMSLTEKGKNIAYKILNDGYIELDEDVFKTYMDAFTLSFRNGLFYEDGNNDFCVPYSVDDYKRFLCCNDRPSLEKVKCLGKQKRPLNNPNLNFSNMRFM